MAEWVLLLGGDRGELERTFAQAEARIAERVGPIRSRSRDHWTEPWGFQDDALFLNRALVIESELAPDALMEMLLAIERELGRRRDASGPRYTPRTLDIDVLFQGERTIATERLTVPHPRVHERAFALAPAADVVPALVHPVEQRSVLALLDRCRA